MDSLSRDLISIIGPSYRDFKMDTDSRFSLIGEEKNRNIIWFWQKCHLKKIEGTVKSGSYGLKVHNCVRNKTLEMTRGATNFLTCSWTSNTLSLTYAPNIMPICLVVLQRCCSSTHLMIFHGLTPLLKMCDINSWALEEAKKSLMSIFMIPSSASLQVDIVPSVTIIGHWITDVGSKISVLF